MLPVHFLSSGAAWDDRFGRYSLELCRQHFQGFFSSFLDENSFVTGGHLSMSITYSTVEVAWTTSSDPLEVAVFTVAFLGLLAPPVCLSRLSLCGLSSYTGNSLLAVSLKLGKKSVMLPVWCGLVFFLEDDAICKSLVRAELQMAYFVNFGQHAQEINGMEKSHI